MPAPFLPETGAFEHHLSRIGAELDAFLAFEHGDAATRIDRWREELTRPVPEQGIGADAVVDELARILIPNGTRISDPRAWAFITTGPTTVPTVATTAAAVASPQRYTITAFNLVEELSLDWLAQVCGLREHMKGVYVSGGSVANLVALGAARQHAFEAAGIDPSADGLDGRRVAIYASEEVHHTVQRAAGVLGLGRKAVRIVPTDGRQRLDTGALGGMLDEGARENVLPVAVVATAGTTNTGAIDPIRAAGQLAREHGAWFHVDGAYGLVGGLDDRIADQYDGLELADSTIVDPHKWFGAPVGVAAAFVRDRSLLQRAFTQEPASYLEGSFSPDDVQSSIDDLGIPYSDFAVELSAPARGVTVWAILREIGVEGLRARVVADIDLARRVTDLARGHPRLEALTEPQLSIACFRYTAPGVDLDVLNRRIVRRLHRETPYVPSSTSVRGAFAIRPCFINARTTPDQVDAFVEAVVAIGDSEVATATAP